MDDDTLSPAGSKAKKSQQGKHPCLICGKTFTFPGGLSKHHSIIHLGIQNAKCKECGKKFATDGRLVLHMRKAHQMKGERAVCDACGKTFATRGAARYHYTLHHLDESHRCAVCGKKTPNMKLHMKKHENKAESKCDICGNMFEGAELLNVHKKVVHDQDAQAKTDDRTCGVCGAQFPDPTALEIHSTVHKPATKSLNCDLCDMSFLKIGSYKRHRRVVHDVDKIPCDKCDKMFLTKREWIEHRRTPHNASKCNFCGQVFEKRAELVYHNHFVHARCQVCRKFFYNKKALVEHRSEYHPTAQGFTKPTILPSQQITVDLNPAEIINLSDSDENDASEDSPSTVENTEHASTRMDRHSSLEGMSREDSHGSLNIPENTGHLLSQNSSVETGTKFSSMVELNNESDFGIKLILGDAGVPTMKNEKVLESERLSDQKMKAAKTLTNKRQVDESSFGIKLILDEEPSSQKMKPTRVLNVEDLIKCGEKIIKKKLPSNYMKKEPSTHRSVEKLPTIEDLLKSGEEILNKKLLSSQMKKGVIIPKNNVREIPSNQEMNTSLDLEKSSYENAMESTRAWDEGTSNQWFDDTESYDDEDISNMIKIEDVKPTVDEEERPTEDDSRLVGQFVVSFSQGNGPITEGLSESEFKLLLDTVDDIIYTEKSKIPPRIEATSFKSGKSIIRCGDWETVEWLKPLARVLGFNARLQYDLRYLKGVVPYPASQKWGKDILEQIWSANNLQGTMCLLNSEVKRKELNVYIEVDETAAMRLESFNCQNGEFRLSCGANNVVVFSEV